MPNPDIRGLFPCTGGLTYLNTATFGPGPQPVMQAVLRSLRDWSSGRGNWLDWERAAEDARHGFAALIGASTESIALLGSMSGAAAQVAHDLPEPSTGRDVIVVGDGEFRSNLFPWMAKADHGFEVLHVGFHDGRLDPEELTRAIDARTAIVALSIVQSASGFRLPLDPVRAACRKHGARLFLDGTQAVGALRVDLDGVDYLAVSGYKWLFAPRGTAFLYVAPEHSGSMRPLTPSWRTVAECHTTYYGPPYDPAPSSAQADHSLAWHSWVGAAAGLALVREVGVEAIEQHGLALAQRFRDGLAEAGLEVVGAGSEPSQIVSVRVPDAEQLAARLSELNVVAAVRGGYLRASFALFNDDSDVERGLAALLPQRT